MSIFIFIAVVVLLLVLALLLRPLMGKTRQNGSADGNQTLSILREQRAELDAELAGGQIDVAEHADGLESLARRLVEEESRQTELQKSGSHRALAGIVGLLVAIFCGVLYLLLGNPLALDPAKRQAVPTITTAQIASMVDKLAAKVAQHPEDTEARLMLSRSYMVLGRYQDAADSYARLAATQPENADVLASWGDAVANAEGGHMTPRAQELIARALKLDPDNVKALALAGTAAFERADYAQAITLWERMSAHVDPQSETGQSARAMIAEARRLSATPASPLTAAGRIRLAPALQGRVSPQDVVFVFARPVAGGPPLAAIRFTAGELPATFDFTQAPLMTQTPPAADTRIIIVARVAKHGSVAEQAGDLVGTSQPLSLGEKSINVTIDSISGTAK